MMNQEMYILKISLKKEEGEVDSTFKTTKEKFLKLIYDWNDIVKQNPKEIIVTVSDDGEIKVEGEELILSIFRFYVLFLKLLENLLL